jgi:hypothetical protein
MEHISGLVDKTQALFPFPMKVKKDLKVVFQCVI